MTTTLDTTALGQGLVLVSPIQPLLMGAALFAWAWVVASVYDKDAARWYFKRTRWNLLHLAAAVVALGAALLTPTFLIGFPVMVAILAADLTAYWLAHNKSDQVPAHEKWSLSLDDWKKRREQRKQAKVARGSTLAISGPKGLVPAPEKETPAYEVRTKLESILLDAVDKRASDVEILPAKDGVYARRMWVDGVPTKPEAVRPEEAVAMIDIMKTAAGLDVSDRRRQLTGEATIGSGEASQKVKVETAGGKGGIRMRVLFNPGARVRFGLEDLGLLENQLEAVRSIVDDARGAVLVAAPPRGGRTATLYALVRSHDAYTQNVQTLERDPQDVLEGVKSMKFDPMEEGPDYATRLRSILRRDPDVVLVGELADEQTAKEVTSADHERTRTYVGLPASSALSAAQAFEKAAGDAKAASEAVHGLIAQRLVRKLCENCKAEYRPTAEMLKKLGVPADKAPQKLYRKGGQVLIKNKPDVCPVCRGTGYMGQTGVFEVYPVGSEERELIASENWSGLRTALRKKKLPTLQEAAVAKVLRGETSVEEVVRATSSGSSGGSSSGGGKSGAAKTASSA